MKHLKWILGIVLMPVVIVGSFLAYSIITDFRPEMVSDSLVLIQNGKPLSTERPIEITTFNIGYGGLDATRDFFMEGGKDSRSESAGRTTVNMEAITNFLKSQDSDIYLLQEVDLKAKRSYNINEAELITDILPGYNASFAINYKVSWVPVPLYQPMGGVTSGLMTMSKGSFEKSLRYSLPGDEPIPKRYFDLKRCIMENTYALDSGKELIVINVHLSAYDEGGKVRAQQIDWLIDHIEKIYDENDNYLIIGGDWNHLMSQALRDKIEGEVPGWAQVLPEKLTDSTGIKLAYDPEVTTSRSNEQPYKKGENFEATIDGFLHSPNLRLLSVKGIDLGFTNSDHNPVTIVLGFE